MKKLLACIMTLSFPVFASAHEPHPVLLVFVCMLWTWPLVLLIECAVYKKIFETGYIMAGAIVLIANVAAYALFFALSLLWEALGCGDGEGYSGMLIGFFVYAVLCTCVAALFLMWEHKLNIKALSAVFLANCAGVAALTLYPIVNSL